MSLDVLFQRTRGWRRWQSLAAIAKPHHAEFAMRVTWGNTRCALLAKEPTPNLWPLISEQQHKWPGILVVPLPDRDLVTIVVWTAGGIDLWRCVHQEALASTLRIVCFAIEPQIRHGFFATGFERHILEAFLPSTSWESIDIQWEQMDTLPALQRTPKLAAALVASLALIAVAWVWPESSEMEHSPINSVGHSADLYPDESAQSVAKDSHVGDALVHHNQVLSALGELPGWSPVHFRWDVHGILVQVRADTGDLLDLHEFAAERGVQIRHKQGGRALYWKFDQARSSHVSPTLPFEAQGDWLEDLIHRQFPGSALHRQNITERLDQERRGRFRLRFDDFTFYDFDRLTHLLAAHPVVIRGLDYEVMRPQGFPWVGRGEMIFEYLGE